MTQAELDYEEAQLVSIMVIASDGGPQPLTSEVEFQVTITDENDNSPTFDAERYGPFSLPENAPVDTHLVTTVVDDPDSGANGDVTLTLSNGQGKFSINADGEITLESSLNREIEDHYSLVVTGTDHGEEPKETSITINVTVLDINDNAPIFNSTLYSTTVAEDTPIGTLIATVEATDLDQAENGTIEFSIVSGNTDDVFNITTLHDGDSYRGELRLCGLFDYEMVSAYVIGIEASDLSSAPMSSTAHVLVTITNVNEHYPVFYPSDNYVFGISEVVKPNTPVGTIIANDDDSGDFGTIDSYSFAPNTSSNVTDTFSISSSTGIITVAAGASLDYETKMNYSFLVVASDGQLNSTASVLVNVENFNDNAPLFENSSYTGSVRENLPINTSVLTVSMIFAILLKPYLSLSLSSHPLRSKLWTVRVLTF